MTLDRERLAIAGTDDLMLVHHPDAGSGDADELALLTSTALPAAGTPEDALRSA